MDMIPIRFLLDYLGAEFYGVRSFNLADTSWFYLTMKTEICQNHSPVFHPRPYGRGLPGRES